MKRKLILLLIIVFIVPSYSADVPKILRGKQFFIRPFFRHKGLFYDIRQKADRNNFYRCRHAAYDFVHGIGVKSSKDRILVGETFEGIGHVIVYVDGLFYDPTNNYVSFNKPVDFFIRQEHGLDWSMPDEWGKYSK